MKLHLLDSNSDDTVFDLSEDGTTIGRSRSCDIAIDNDQASGSHAKITCEDGDWTVHDLESTNGVRVNGTRISESSPIKKGDRVGIGTETYLFTDEAVVSSTKIPAAAKATALAKESQKSVPAVGVETTEAVEKKPVPEKKSKAGVIIVGALAAVAALLLIGGVIIFLVFGDRCSDGCCGVGAHAFHTTSAARS